MSFEFKVQQEWMFLFAERILQEGGIHQDSIDEDLDSMVFEAGERNWEKIDFRGEVYYLVPEDFY